MTAISATAPNAPAPRRRRLGRDTRVAYLYILPAVLVMVTITFYPLAFQTALSMLPLVRRADALRLLKQRLANLDAAAEGYDEKSADTGHVPPHVLAVMDYWDRVGKVEREWLLRLLFRIEDGELDFLGEPMGWTPAPDDPGHQMSADRERYLAMLRG